MPGELYSRDHQWVRREGSCVRVGLSEFAQEELGEVAFVELPSPGRTVRTGEAVCVIDSLKSTSEVYAPVSGRIAEVNRLLEAEKCTRLVNQDPLGEGWLFVVEMDDARELDSLMPLDRYLEYVGRGRPEGGDAPGPEPL